MGMKLKFVIVKRPKERITRKQKKTEENEIKKFICLFLTYIQTPYVVLQNFILM